MTSGILHPATPLLAGEPQTPAAAEPRCRLGFYLFILLNAVLFVRPAEIVPAVTGWPIYEVLIVLCLLASIPVVAEQLTWDSLKKSPATFFVLALVPAIVLSNLSHRDLYSARMNAFAFSKVVIYFLLLVGLVNSPQRLRVFLLVLLTFVLGIALLSLLEYHDVVHIEAMKTMVQLEGVDAATGDRTETLRLRGPGIFNDPNDMSLVLVVGMMVAGHFLFSEDRSRFVRARWLVPLSVFAYAFALTKSRGGLFSLLTGFLVLAVSRFGRRKATLLCLVAVPALLLAVGGRQTNFDLDNGDDSAQGRILLWRDGMALMRGAPVFGIGYGEFVEELGHVAHNSYVHCFTELGLVGGLLFFGCVYVPLAELGRRRGEAGHDLGDELHWWWPCILAIFAGYATGMMTLSRAYTVSTYVVLGTGVAYCRLMRRQQPEVSSNLDYPLARRVAATGVVFLLVINVFVRIFAK